MGILGTNAPLSSDASLLLQVVVVLILSAAVYRAKDRRYLQHAYMMLVCTALHTVSVFLVMVPVALRLVQGVDLSGFLALVLVHAAAGVIVLALSIHLMRVWGLGKVGPCFRQKARMRLLAVAWVTEVAAGIAIYYLLYV